VDHRLPPSPPCSLGGLSKNGSQLSRRPTQRSLSRNQIRDLYQNPAASAYPPTLDDEQREYDLSYDSPYLDDSLDSSSSTHSIQAGLLHDSFDISLCPRMQDRTHHSTATNNDSVFLDSKRSESDLSIPAIALSDVPCDEKAPLVPLKTQQLKTAKSWRKPVPAFLETRTTRGITDNRRPDSSYSSFRDGPWNQEILDPRLADIPVKSRPQTPGSSYDRLSQWMSEDLGNTKPGYLWADDIVSPSPNWAHL